MSGWQKKRRRLLKRLIEIIGLLDIRSLGLLPHFWKSGNLPKILRMMISQIAFKQKPSPLPLDELLSTLTKKPSRYVIPPEHMTDIIVPVYNGFNFLQTLIKQLFRNTQADFRLIIVNDASSDKRVKPFLDKIAMENQSNVILLENSQNIGFVKSVNKAYSYTKNHFVLLNTDVELPQGWLSRLMKPIYDSDEIASTTPFTNSGKICGFPYMGDNPLFENLDVNEIDSFFQHVNTNELYEIPTGVGFCMGINRHVSEAIGMFDDTTFPKGYGEENDWCMRAKKNGRRNVIVPNLYVYHKHGGSFTKAGKKRLLASNFRKLLKRYPDYLPAVYDFTKKDPLRKIREILILLITSNTGDSKPVLLERKTIKGLSFKDKREKQLVLLYNPKDRDYRLIYSYGNYFFEMSLRSKEKLSKLANSIPINNLI